MEAPILEKETPEEMAVSNLWTGDGDGRTPRGASGRGSPEGQWMCLASPTVCRPLLFVLMLSYLFIPFNSWSMTNWHAPAMQYSRMNKTHSPFGAGAGVGSPRVESTLFQV